MLKSDLYTFTLQVLEREKLSYAQSAFVVMGGGGGGGRIKGSVHGMLGSLYLRYCNINLTACARIKQQELISLNDITDTV